MNSNHRWKKWPGRPHRWTFVPKTGGKVRSFTQVYGPLLMLWLLVRNGKVEQSHKLHLKGKHMTQKGCGWAREEGHGGVRGWGRSRELRGRGLVRNQSAQQFLGQLVGPGCPHNRGPVSPQTMASGATPQAMTINYPAGQSEQAPTLWQ